MRDEFYFPSKDGNTEIHTMEWKPAGEVKAVVQLCHGMVEYIKRYDEFAEFLCSHGYYVVGNDHLGHGKFFLTSCESEKSERKNKETSKGICFGILMGIATVNEGVYADFSGTFSSIKTHIQNTNDARATHKTIPRKPR